MEIAWITIVLITFFGSIAVTSLFWALKVGEQHQTIIRLERRLAFTETRGARKLGVVLREEKRDVF